MVSTQAIVGVAVSLLLIAILFPIAMTEIVGANQTGWDASLITIFGTVVPILAVIGLAIKYIPRGKKGMVTTQAIVGVAVSLLLFAILVPIAVTMIVNTNVDTWDTAVGVIFVTVLPILAMIGIAVKYIPSSKSE